MTAPAAAETAPATEDASTALAATSEGGVRGMQAVEWGYPFASVDSTDVAQNHNRRKPRIGGLIEAAPHDLGEGARLMAARWDAQQCPGAYVRRATQGELVA